MFENTTDKKKEKPNSNKEENTTATMAKLSSSNNSLKSCQIKPCPKKNTVDLDTRGGPSLVQESIQICQSLVSPKTLLTGTGTPLWGRSRRSVTSTSTVTGNGSSPHTDNNKSLVLCSTTLGSLSHLPQQNLFCKTVGATVGLVEDKESAELLVEEEERCGSYDAVVLEDDDVINEADRLCDTEYVSDFDSGCYMLEDFDSSTEGQVMSRENTSVEKNSKTTDRTDQLKRTEQRPADACFAVPKAVTWKSRAKKHEGLKTSLYLREKSDGAPQTSRTNTPSPLRHKPFIPEKTSTPNTSFAKPKPVSVQNRKFKEPHRSSFTIYTDPTKQAAASSTSSYTSKSVLHSLSTNTLSSCTNRSFTSVTMKGGQKITSPLCSCGRRAKRQVVSNGGPNHGRGFYCCPVRRSGSGGRIQKGCEFFKWESSLVKSIAVASPAVRSSVSLCQATSAVNCRPQQRSTLRKSY